MSNLNGFAIFGLGRAGKIHIANILANKHCTLKYAIDPEVEARELTRHLLHAESPVEFLEGTTKELDKVMQDADVKGVLICSTTSSHYPLTLLALKNGKAVFCEKPISTDINEVEECYAIAAKAGLPLHCSFNRRYDPQLLTLKNRLSESDAGAVHVIKTCSRDCPRPPIDFLKVSGGFFHDCASHDIDLICWLTGKYPCRIFATGSTHDKEIKQLHDVDTAVIIMNFPPDATGRPGPIGIIDISRHGCYGYDQRVEVLCDGGMFRSENQLQPSLLVDAPIGQRGGQILHSFPQRYASSYVNSLDHFLALIADDKSKEITAKEVLTVTKLAELCEESCASGQPIDFKL